MTNDEIAELVVKGREDGATLYRVANAIYKIAIAINWVIGVAGVVIAVFVLQAGFLPALSVLVATVGLCSFGYATAVLGTHGAKVLVHILFANIVLIDKGQK